VLGPCCIRLDEQLIVNPGHTLSMATITLRSGAELGDAMVAQRCIAGAPFRVDTARLPGRSGLAKGKASVLGRGCVMQVDEILASKGREVRTIQPDATIGEAIGRLCAERVGALVVSEDGRRIAGIISDRGITWAIAERGAGVVKERVRTVMTERVITCRAGDTVGRLMAIMTERRIRHIPVVDAAGALSGIISIGDVVKHRLGELEEEAGAMREYISGSR
jgi:CBS domain-containing protein